MHSLDGQTTFHMLLHIDTPLKVHAQNTNYQMAPTTLSYCMIQYNLRHFITSWTLHLSHKQLFYWLE